MREVTIAQRIDLRGVRCPLNYVKTRLGLEELRRGQVLEVYLDDGESILSVTRSAKEDGHKILKIERIKDYFKVLVRKND